MTSISERALLEREIYVNSVRKYHVKIKSNLETVIEKIGWTPEHILSPKSPKVTCSYCPEHKMPAESLKKHEEMCYLVREKGYTIEDLEKEAPSSKFFYEKSKIMTITLEKDVINGILDKYRRRYGKAELKSPTTGERDVPQTLAAAKVNFSPAERLILHDSVVKLAKESHRMPTIPEDNLLTADLEELLKNTPNDPTEPSSEAEKWAAMRDYKRRRQSYRAKNVHITKKAYTEIIREVINNQVELLQETMKCDDKFEAKFEAKRKADKRKADSNTPTSETASNVKSKDRESPERKKRDADKSDSRTRDQKKPDDRHKERERNNSSDSRKRDRKSPDSKNRRSHRESPQRNRRESPQRIRRESPQRSRRESPQRNRRESPQRSRRERSPRRSHHGSPRRSHHGSPRRGHRESPDSKRRSRNSPYSRKRDYRSPDKRKREMEDDPLRSAKRYYPDEQRSRGGHQDFQMLQAKVDNIVDALVNFH